MRRRRTGIATIEFVMVWPLLLMLMAGIFLMARAGIAKAATATQSRAKAWDAKKKAPAGEPYVWDHNPRDSEVSGESRVTVAHGTLFPSDRFTAESSVFTIDKVWDYRDQAFKRIPPMRVHEDPFKQIAKNLPGGRLGNVSPVALLARTLATIVRLF